MPLPREDAEKLLRELDGWNISADGTAISKVYKRKNFVDAMDFANAITPIAEAEGHHPDLAVSWGSVGITLTTHAIGGLSENDFIMAAKIDELGA